MHLIVGQAGDSCSSGVLARLVARGCPVRLVGSPLAAPARLAWRLDGDGLTSRLGHDEGDEEIESVLVRGTPWVDPTGWGPEDHAYVQAEMLAATLAWLAALPCPVVNRPSAALWYRGRGSLLAWRPLLRGCGLRAPEQVITNDPAAARSFGDALAADGVGGAVLSPLTSESRFAVATDAAWQGLAELQERSPVCLSEPHGATLPACVLGGQVVWDRDPPAGFRALEPRLVRLAATAELDFLEVVTAPLRGGPGVVLVEPMPVLEHFVPATRDRVLDRLTELLAPIASGQKAIA